MLRSRLAWLIVGILALLMPVWSAPSAAQDDDIDPVEFRFAHLSPDAPAVDVYANGVLLAEDVAFGTVTAWQVIAEDRYDLAVTLTGEDVEGAVFTADNVDLTAAADVRITVAAYGSVARGTLAAAVIRENFTPTNSARLEIFHAFERGPSVDLISGDLLLVGGIGYPNSGAGKDGHFTLDLPAREYPDLRLEADNTDITLLSAGDVTFEAGQSYFIAAVGPYTEPSLIVVESEIGTPEPVATPADTDDAAGPDATETPSPAATTDDDTDDDGGEAATPAATETPFVSTVDFAYVRIGHFSPDAPDVDLYLNGIRVGEAVPFKSMTDWLLLPGNIVDVAVVVSGDVLENAVLSLSDVGLPVTDRTQRATIAVTGSVEDGTIAFQIFVEDFSPVGDDQSRLEVFHAIEGGPGIDVLLNNTPIVSGLAYPGSQGDNDGQFGAVIPAALSDINVTDSATGDLVVFVDGVVFAPQTSYLVVITASPTEVLVLRFATPIPN